jgi:threonine/homoserine/homoserine lactone efflux protein
MIIILLHALSLALTPLLSFGPFKIFVLSQAIQKGWRRTLRLALTPLVADIPVIITVWLLLSRLPEWTIHVLQFSGGLFFIYLASVLYRRARVAPVSADTLPNAPDHSFRQAVTSIWINPQVYINWGIIGVPALLNYSEQSVWHAAAFLFFFYVIWVGGLALQIILFGTLGTINQRANTSIIILASVLLLCFGIYQIWIGITTLLN